MPKVIDIATRRARRDDQAAALAKATALLESIHEQLFDAAFQLAVADSWREWDEATPDVTNVEIDPAALLECPDAEVRALARLWVEVDGMLERMETGVERKRAP